MKTQSMEFEEDPPRLSEADESEAGALLLNIDGYEGPLDVLLDLARSQKVDLTCISILQLARQYLVFVEKAKERNLDLAAEYLVMAAWLAYLKSRLLIPREEEGDDPGAEEMAEALQFQLRRLEAMRAAADKLFGRPQLGKSIFARGMPEGLSVRTRVHWQVKIYDLLKAYGDIKKRADSQSYELPEYHLMSTDDALKLVRKMLGDLPRKGKKSVWATLESLLPPDIKDKLFGRSALASSLVAGLELTKQGKMEIRQDGLFRPIYVRARDEGKKDKVEQ